MAHQHTTQPDQAFRRIAVVGFGLVGASFAASTSRAWRIPDAVLAVDIDERTLAEAVERGWATDGALPDDPAFERFVGDGCDLVVLATPVGAAERYFEDLARWDYLGIVTDTASTKARITALAERVLPHPRTSCPGIHGRLRGTVNGDPSGARPGHNSKRGARTGSSVLTPTRPPSTSRACTSWSPPSARASSRRARTTTRRWPWSAVPHIMASSLRAAGQPPRRRPAGAHAPWPPEASRTPRASRPVRPSCGAASPSTTRTRCPTGSTRSRASSARSPTRWHPTTARRSLRFWPTRRPRAARRALPAAWVPSTERLLEVRIPMEDRPGVVAEVTTVTSSVGCNIQSIEIDHVTEDSAVLSLVLTDEGDIGQLSAQLINAGFSVSFSPLTAKEHTHVA